MPNVQYLLHHQIDKKKWDECIDSAINGLIYGYSFYLDAMCNWDALVMGNYDFIMPLPFKKKWGITYLYQPPFVQQLGIFGQQPISDIVLKSFVAEAQQRFKFAEIFVNFNIGIAQPNFILPLHKPYAVIKQGYKNDVIKNLKRTTKFQLHYLHSTDFVQAINLYKKYYANKTPHVKEKAYQQFFEVCQQAQKKKLLLIKKIEDNEKNILAIALFFKAKDRLYNVMSTVTDRGKKQEANYFLFDKLIEEFSEKNVVLDFEGSSINGIASFYKKFGSVNEPYYFFRYNNLPWPIKYLK